MVTASGGSSANFDGSRERSSLQESNLFWFMFEACTSHIQGTSQVTSHFLKPLARTKSWLVAHHMTLMTIADTPHSIAFGSAIGIFFGFSPLVSAENIAVDRRSVDFPLQQGSCRDCGNAARCSDLGNAGNLSR